MDLEFVEPVVDCPTFVGPDAVRLQVTLTFKGGFFFCKNYRDETTWAIRCPDDATGSTATGSTSPSPR